MVVVRGVDDGLIVLRRAGNAAHNVGAGVAAHTALNVCTERDRQLDGVEAGLAGAFDGLIEIAHAGHVEELLRNIVLNPRGGAQSSRGIALEIALLNCLRVADHVPRIAGQIGAVNNEHAHGSAARGFLVFVGPPAVVGEGRALEETVVVRGRLIDDDQNNFALYVYAVIVVPLVLWRIDAIADEDDGGAEVGGGLAGLVLGDDLRAVVQRDRLAACWDEGEFGLVLDGVHGVEGHALEVGSVVARRLHAGEGKLRGDVFGGQFGSARAGPAAFKQIEREKAHVGADLFRIDGPGGGAGGRGQAGDGGNHGLRRLLRAGHRRNRESCRQGGEDKSTRHESLH